MTDEDPQTLGEVWKSPRHRRALLLWTTAHLLFLPACGVVLMILEGRQPMWGVFIVLSPLVAALGPYNYLRQLDMRRVTGFDYINRWGLRRLRRRAARDPSAATEYLVALENHIQRVRQLSLEGGSAARVTTGWDVEGILRSLERERDATRRRLRNGAT